MAQIALGYGTIVICNILYHYSYISHLYSPFFLSLTLYIFSFFVFTSFVYFVSFVSWMHVNTCMHVCCDLFDVMSV